MNANTGMLVAAVVASALALALAATAAPASAEKTGYVEGSVSGLLPGGAVQVGIFNPKPEGGGGGGAEGHFIYPILPGVYYVEYSETHGEGWSPCHTQWVPGGNNYPPVYFPGVDNLSEASPITVGPGETTNIGGVTVPPGGRIKGSLVDAETGKPPVGSVPILNVTQGATQICAISGNNSEFVEPDSYKTGMMRAGAYTATVTFPGYITQSAPVVVSGGGESEWNASLQKAPALTVTKLKPATGPASGGTSVAITGTGFTGATNVYFGSAKAPSFTVHSSTSITATAPAQPGSGTVVVEVEAWQQRSPEVKAAYYKAAPAITAMSSHSGSVAGGETITVTGTAFRTGTNQTSFKFGTTASSFANCSTSTSCLVRVPPHSAGTVAVKATANGATSAKSPEGNFTYA